MQRTIAALLLAAATPAALASLTCADVSYGSPRRSENMDKLAQQARLPDGYWHRYHEDVVSDLCKGNEQGLNGSVDMGYVKRSEIEGIREAMGLDKRSKAGRSYGNVRKVLSDWGACSACADNEASYYTDQPKSKCGQLVKSALEGDVRAREALVEWPDFCKVRSK